MRIYVGNLPCNVTEAEITSEFGTYGNVESTMIPFDNTSGQSKGFAFVEMPSRMEAEAAIAGLNGKMLSELSQSTIYDSVRIIGEATSGLSSIN